MKARAFVPISSVLPVLLALAAVMPVSAISRDDVIEGNPASRVRVVIYEDLQCSDCARLRTLLDEKILPKYGARVAFVHRDCPLGKHDWARAAAIAGRWVYQQSSGAGIAFRREILAEQDNIGVRTLPLWLGEFAARNFLDPKGIVASLDDRNLGARVDQEREAAMARGVTRLPTVVVGGQTLVETIVYEDLASAIDQALK